MVEYDKIVWSNIPVPGDVTQAFVFRDRGPWWRRLGYILRGDFHRFATYVVHVDPAKDGHDEPGP